MARGRRGDIAASASLLALPVRDVETCLCHHRGVV